jgi:very-short-patch-repair endonuclease
MISRRVAQGRLHRVHRGVYALGRPDLSQAGVCHAAALAIGEDAFVTHRAAAALDGFWKRRLDRVEITVARRVASRAGIRVYVADLPRSDWCWCEGMRITMAERTVLDLAVTVRSERVFRRTVHEALIQERVSEHTLRRAIEAHPDHKGAKRLAAEIRDGAKPTRSSFEDWGVELLRAHDLPAFETNFHPPGTPDWIEVDVYFPEQRLVIELDGDRYHRTPYRREQDANKQSIIEAAGIKVLRLTDEDGEPKNEARTVERIEAALT